MTKIKCGNCHEMHESVAEVRACYGRGDGRVAVEEPKEPVVPEWAKDPATEKQLKYLTGLMEQKDHDNLDNSEVQETLMNLMDGKTIGKREASAAIEALLPLHNRSHEYARWPSVVEGRYALYTGDGTVAFYKVDRPTEGKWAGRIFVKLLIGAPGHWHEMKASLETMARIEEMGAVESARLFGYKSKSCGQCGSPLSNLRSRAAGFGEVCAAKLGWPYPSENEARRILREMGEPVEVDA